MSNVSPEEAQALADELAPAAGRREAVVATRDFSAPQRLGAERQAALRKALKKTVVDVGRTLSGWLRRTVEVELVDVGEVDATRLFADARAPFCVLAFAAGAEQAREAASPVGWLVWDAPSAGAAAELALGGELPGEASGGTAARPLSDVERSIVGELLTDAATPLAAGLGLALRDAALLQEDHELPVLTEQAEAGDTRRLSVHLALRGLGEAESTLRLYLPDPGGHEAHDAEPVGAALPTHLGPVPIELSAELGSVEIALADLLALEVGDVLALGVDAGSPVAVRVEQEPCGTAELGRRSGHLVVRIQELGPVADLDL